MPKAVFVSRTILFGDCDPAGVVYTPRFSYFSVEAIYVALDEWLGTPGLRTLMGFEILPPVRAMSMEFLMPLTWEMSCLSKSAWRSWAFIRSRFWSKGSLLMGPYLLWRMSLMYVSRRKPKKL